MALCGGPTADTEGGWPVQNVCNVGVGLDHLNHKIAHTIEKMLVCNCSKIRCGDTQQNRGELHL